MLSALLGGTCLARALFLGLNLSKFFYNYRMVSNLLAVSRGLRLLGLREADMLLGSTQASFNHWANFPPNSQRFEDDEPGQNLLGGAAQIDLFNEDMSLQRVLMGLAGRFEEDDPLNKRLEFARGDTLFVYLVGHGGDDFIRVKYLEVLFARNFSDFFEELFVGGKAAAALVISDSCSAGTLFATVERERVDALLFGSSTWDDSALSLGFDRYVGQPLKDRFSYPFAKMLERLAGSRRPVPLPAFLRKFSHELIGSTALHFNHWRLAGDLRPFFENVPPRTETFDLDSRAAELERVFGP